MRSGCSGVEDAGESQFGVTQRLTVNARAAGPRLGKDVQAAIRGSKSGDWQVADDGTVTSGGFALVEGEYPLETVVAGGDEADHRAVGVLPRDGFVVLDTEVTPELEAVGVVRDVVRVVQQARRDAGLHVSDRIRLTVAGDEPVWRALTEHQGLLMSETLAAQVGLAGDLDALPLGDGRQRERRRRRAAGPRAGRAHRVAGIRRNPCCRLPRGLYWLRGSGSGGGRHGPRCSSASFEAGAGGGRRLGVRAGGRSGECLVGGTTGARGRR